jgi:ubiquinone/menaquinone biosynthesis C-methylase UbiE
MADKQVNSRYAYMRNEHNKNIALANGYRFQGFFLKENNLALSLIDSTTSPILDVGCGSGLTLLPLINSSVVEKPMVIGLDYNQHACIDAKSNKLVTIRGDAFSLPFKRDTVHQIINCQFLNQQTSKNAKEFISEANRILQPGGTIVILWRNGRSAIHIISHFLFNLMDKLKGRPIFPQYIHSLNDLKDYSEKLGLQIKKEAITLPFTNKEYISTKNPLSKLIGASNLLVLKKPA